MAHAHPGLDGSDPEIPRSDLRRSEIIAPITRESPVRRVRGAGLLRGPITSRTVRAQGIGGGVAEPSDTIRGTASVGERTGPESCHNNSSNSLSTSAGEPSEFVSRALRKS